MKVTAVLKDELMRLNSQPKGGDSTGIINMGVAGVRRLFENEPEFV
jgi:hypothetical protein